MHKSRFINVCPQNRRMEQFTQFTYYETENALAFKMFSEKQYLLEFINFNAVHISVVYHLNAVPALFTASSSLTRSFK